MKLAKTIRITFVVSQVEKGRIDDICEYDGSSVSELMRSFIREKHEEMFPPHKYKKLIAREIIMKSKAQDKKPKISLSKDQICELLGGRVGEKNGIAMCVGIPDGHGKVSAPLDMMGTGAYRVEVKDPEELLAKLNVSSDDEE